VGYPQYASAPGPYTIERQFGVFDPAFDPSREDTFGFLDGVIGEMAALFPDPYWHIGGDEVTGKLWDENPRIIRFKRQHAMADDAALQAWFNGRLSQILTRHQRQMIGWDEILHPDLPRSTVVQSWRGPEYLEQAAQAGYRGILSAPYYLDHMLSAGEHYLSDPSPPEDSLTPEQAASILGGEACMWAEHVSPETVDSRIWPRTAAIAERFWSPSAVRDVDDMYRRLSVESVRLEELGLTHEVHSARMLRRIVGARKVEPLRKLLEITEPVTFRQRVRLQAPTQLTPLTHLVDAARPDPWMRHDLERLAAALDTNPGAGPALEAEFRTWLPLPARLAEMARDAPLASEGEPAARAAAQIAQTGLEALGYLRQGSPPPGWVDRARLLLAEAEKPQGLLHLVGVDAVRSLVERVAERGPAASR
jgi:hexosaminidase